MVIILSNLSDWEGTEYTTWQCPHIISAKPSAIQEIGHIVCPILNRLLCATGYSVTLSLSYSFCLQHSILPTHLEILFNHSLNPSSRTIIFFGRAGVGQGILYDKQTLNTLCRRDWHWSPDLSVSTTLSAGSQVYSFTHTLYEGFPQAIIVYISTMGFPTSNHSLYFF